ncbi:Aldo/keto reductase [Pleomassaria siparia CBS 279.74]|uniref:Aldo/keto reductase n=1 Tax=Pleomassaria siparia CBS 279.74 TaxID=1314801 RepID=A0A6G1JQZ2_9PLEO|nr:Aldo/keto reductase [Pleomassaria siparia CBS 279.74]
MSIKVVFGGGSISSMGAFNTDESVAEALNVLKASGVLNIDTARSYPASEGNIGRATDRESFTIDTKIIGGWSPGSAKKEAIITDSQNSLETVKIKQFDILYLHSPDVSIPIEETLEGINEAYKKGIFRRFGLSNFSAEQVQEAYDVAKSKGYVLPSVYQGNYSAIARHAETLLFPTLRKLGFAFYAYSPLAGGFLTKTIQSLDEGVGRFSDDVIGGLYNALYNKPTLRGELAEWKDIAEKEGVSKAELAYRWVGYNSVLKPEFGDGVIFGASSIKQIEQTAASLKKGPLSEEAVKRIDAIWRSVEKDAPIDNFITFVKKNSKV